MSKIDKLRKQNNVSIQTAKFTMGELRAMGAEANRVADIAKDVHVIVSDLDRQFEQVTGLTKRDIIFLLFATALQCVRQYVIANITERKNDGEAAKPLHEMQDKIFDKSYVEDITSQSAKWYYAPLNEIIGTYGVPYDVVAGSKKFGLGGDGKGLSGSTHRSRTAGHDALLGWVFGTANILTNTLTEYSCIYSYHVKGGQIIAPAHTTKVLSYTGQRWKEDKVAVGAALIKQGLHFSSDMYTKCGLPLPLISKGLSPETAQILATFGQDVGAGIRMESIVRMDLGNALKIGTSAEIAILINSIIGMIHALYYDESLHGSLNLYSVRTRKILSYSNMIASMSNVIVTSIMAVVAGHTSNEKLAQKAVDCFDLGGLMVTIYRIVNDYKFIKEIKQEFIEKEFYNIVMG